MARMAAGRPASGVRLSAEQRRAELLEAAASQFAIAGFRGTSTEAIARRAGISHAYLFRLFPTKKDLFLAIAQRCFERTRDVFRAAAGATPEREQRLHAMGEAYVELLGDRELLLLQMQLYAACSDPEIRDVVRSGYDQLRREVAELSGAPPEDIYAFFAAGMLLNVAAAMDYPDIGDIKSWSC
jgi:AcrR family transcriptional regulator